MEQKYEMRIIAHIRTDFPEKFGVPRQSGLVKELIGRIVFEPEYRNPDALRGIEGLFVALVEVRRRRAGKMVSYGASPKTRRRDTCGGICDKIAFQTESDWIVICEIRRNRADRRGDGTNRVRH